MIPKLTANIGDARKSRMPIDVQRMLERMYDAIDRPQIDRDYLRDCTDQLATISMVNAEPQIIENDFEECGLTKSERRIAMALKRNLGLKVTTEWLFSTMFGGLEAPPEVKIITVYICKIRSKLKASGSNFAINTIHGEGFQMVLAEKALPVQATYIPPMGKRSRPIWNGIHVSPRICEVLNFLEGRMGKNTPISLISKALGITAKNIAFHIFRARMKLEGSKYRIVMNGYTNGYALEICGAKCDSPNYHFDVVHTNGR